MRQSEGDDIHGAGEAESINSGLERGAGGHDVVDNYIGMCRIGGVRDAEGAAHVFSTLLARE